MSSKRLLVIGGKGFIGRHVCRAARDAGFCVTSLSLNPGGAQAPGVRYLHADIANAAALGAALAAERFEYVVNSSAYIDHRLFNNGGRSQLDSHFGGVQNLVERLDRDVLERLVQLGSSDEYGPAPAPQREDARESPSTPYALGKLTTTHFLAMLWRTERFPGVVVRLFLTYGPGQARTRFLPQVIHGCLEDRSFPVSEGLQLRDFCHVSDIAQGILRALTAPEACGEVINLGSGAPVTIRAAIEQVRDAIGRGTPAFGQVPYRPGENPRLYAEPSKARALLQWQPRIGFAEGLRETIAFYRDGERALP